jgi:hypothetical protein
MIVELIAANVDAYFSKESSVMSIKLNTALTAKRRKWLQQFEDQCAQNPAPELDQRKFFYDCICPRCEKQHRVYMNWTGRGKPRIYCELCKPAVSGINATAAGPIASGIYQAGKRQVCPQAE